MEYKARLIRNTIIISVLLITLGLIVAIAFAAGDMRPKSEDNESVSLFHLTVEKGTGTEEIADTLYASDIIRSKYAFKAYSYLSGKGAFFKPGIYEVSSTESIPEIATMLALGPKSISAIITPGMTLKEIDDHLSSLKIISKNSLAEFDVNELKEKFLFLENAPSLEGFLFPDTYMFFAGTEAKNVAEKILNNFQAKIASLLQDSRNYENIDWLIIASMLEKEVIGENDLNITSGIIQNRLAKKMPLQIDATVIYAKCQGKFLNCPKLSSQDLKIDSPYNTYKYQGLPPAPISNPGASAIKAAMDPKTTNYLFYLSDPKTKETIFAKTLEEHARNRVKYLGM